MTEERRYTDEEIREIFGAATEAGESHGRAPSTGTGLTLRELQEIAGEVGVAPERIAEAASALDLRRNVRPRRTHLGQPLSVGRTVDLPRAPTDQEWEMIVAELRETFNARGKVSVLGGLREWRNGNLHACIEPTEAGHRLRLGTLKGESLTLARLGTGGILSAIILLVVFLLTGETDAFGGPLLLAAGGAAALVASAVRLPGWAREREDQMEYIAARTLALLGRGS
jgi:hypothetical protein